MRPPRTVVFAVLLLVVAGVACWQPAAAQFGGMGKAPFPAAKRPGEVSADPAFDRFVDLNLLAAAWAYKNAPLLADIGLELAEGERVLLRPHKLIRADQVLGVAAKLAADKKDAATLERLAKAAEALQRPELTAQVGAAQKLSLTSRADDPILKIDVEKMAPEVYLLFRDSIESIKSAKLAGDADTLEIIAQLTPEMTQLSQAQRKYLIKLAKDAQAALPKDGGLDPAAVALNGLLSETRAGPPTKLDPVLRIEYQPSVRGCQVVGVTPGGALVLAEGTKLAKGDLILRIGQLPAYGPTLDLGALIDAAYESGNTEVLIFEAKERKVRHYHLPTAPEEK